MATFQAQIEGLTGLSLTASTAPTLNEVTQFLRDGVLDVTQKCIRMNPQDASGFTRVSSDQTSNNSLDINGATILSVVREAGVSDDWRECRQIPPGLQSRVTDSTSLHYASPYNPAYVILDNGKVSVFPAPDSDPKQFKVYYINNVPVDKSSAALLYSHSDIGFFLDDKVYLVVIYASIRTIDANLEFPTIPAFPDISDLVLSWSFQDVPTVPTTTVPVPPVLSNSTLSSTTVSALNNPPLYIIPSLSTSFADIDTQITNEDPEMAGVVKDKIIQQISEYEATVKNNLNEFNKNKTIYEAELKKTLKEADIASQEAIKLSELSSKDDTDKIQKYKTEIDSYVSEIQKYRAEIESYTSNIGQVVQENQGKISQYQQNVSLLIEHHRQKIVSLIEEFNANAGWLQSRKQDLIQEYNNAFNMIVPAKEQEPRPQQQERG
ncbi:MAG: hypothetical protein Unbinned3849contig1000_45 [Prokaryotic dsDNA virus sp.]|nr:MAG: hypothetical protein Unbinned3849contig1000_45 [Prokaryotic dsDNA virus sp.]|tara:strand:+ start:930 stop:2237 length:1308 start_codon:yes stop_codon:yes gene_type:complete